MKLLHIDSSILGQHSASREIGAAWVGAWREQNPDKNVRYQDLARDTVPLWNDKRTLDYVRAFEARERLEDWLPLTANPPTPAWPEAQPAWSTC